MFMFLFLGVIFNDFIMALIRHKGQRIWRIKEEETQNGDYQ
jgi:5-methylcytosine-specific restriction endonuclease McrBC regulatory subunit McrC